MLYTTEEMKPRINRRKIIITIRTKVIKYKVRENKTKSWFFEKNKSNKIDKPLGKLIREKKKKKDTPYQISRIKGLGLPWCPVVENPTWDAGTGVWSLVGGTKVPRAVWQLSASTNTEPKHHN